MQSKKSQSAFSLIELSIVLVILGLLTGGILAGQSLIRAAELRAAVTESQKNVAAHFTFKDKYLAIAGDMPNAVRFWGARAGGTADGADSTCTSSTNMPASTETCNGNGDGIIATQSERFSYWQHLASAGLIEGNYSGFQGSPSFFVAGVNTPISKLKNGTWSIFNSTAWQGTNIMGNRFVYSALGAGASTNSGEGLLKPEEIWNIDSKMDDGKPDSGKVTAFTGATYKAASPTNPINCITPNYNAPFNYILSENSNSCFGWFWL